MQTDKGYDLLEGIHPKGDNLSYNNKLRRERSSTSNRPAMWMKRLHTATSMILPHSRGQGRSGRMFKARRGSKRLSALHFRILFGKGRGSDSLCTLCIFVLFFTSCTVIPRIGVSISCLQ